MHAEEVSMYLQQPLCLSVLQLLTSVFAAAVDNHTHAYKQVCMQYGVLCLPCECSAGVQGLLPWGNPPPLQGHLWQSQAVTVVLTLLLPIAGVPQMFNVSYPGAPPNLNRPSMLGAGVGAEGNAAQAPTGSPKRDMDSMFRCPVCFEDLHKDDVFVASMCGHEMCRGCARQMVLTAIRSAFLKSHQKMLPAVTATVLLPSDDLLPRCTALQICWPG